MKDFLLWKHARPIFYMTSTAATWIWAPAIFVSSDKAYFTGLPGFLLFLIPNALTLALFAFFAYMVRNKTEGFTLADAIKEAGRTQQDIHLLVSSIVLICSTCVQLIGLHILFQSWYPIPKPITALFVSIAALLMVWRDGIKGSIKTDFFKYVLMFGIGAVLLLVTICGHPEPHWQGMKPVPFGTLFATFGLPTMIGLLAAPYADQTFWQRVFSIDKDRIKSTFIGSALLFALIPILFGLIGFFAMPADNWNIANAFPNIFAKILLAICVLAALLSTLDSNLCAISSIICTRFHTSIQIGRYSMAALLLFSSLVMINTELTITGLFLIYGTIRTCISLPTILIILNKYNKKRLLIGTILSVLIAPMGYILSDGYWLFTVLAFLIPIIGYKFNN